MSSDLIVDHLAAGITLRQERIELSDGEVIYSTPGQCRYLRCSRHRQT